MDLWELPLDVLTCIVCKNLNQFDIDSLRLTCKALHRKVALVTGRNATFSLSPDYYDFETNEKPVSRMTLNNLATKFFINGRIGDPYFSSQISLNSQDDSPQIKASN